MNEIPSSSNRPFAGCILVHERLYLTDKSYFPLNSVSSKLGSTSVMLDCLRLFSEWLVGLFQWLFNNRSPWIHQHFQDKGICIKLHSPFALLTSCLRTPVSGRRMVSHKASPASIVSLDHTFEHKEWKIRSTPTVLQTRLCLSVGQKRKES